MILKVVIRLNGLLLAGVIVCKVFFFLRLDLSAHVFSRLNVLSLLSCWIKRRCVRISLWLWTSPLSLSLSLRRVCVCAQRLDNMWFSVVGRKDEVMLIFYIFIHKIHDTKKNDYTFIFAHLHFFFFFLHVRCEVEFESYANACVHIPVRLKGVCVLFV